MSGPWSPARVGRHLEEARVPLRLGCLSPSGHPRVVSLWYLWRDGALWCATRADARVARFLWEDPRCGFEVAADAPPYRGVRGTGRAELRPQDGPAVLRRLVQRYLGRDDGPLARWLLERPGEVAIRIEPQRLASWDYRARMEPAASAAGGAP